MTTYLRLDGVEMWHQAGWTMVHFVWLGALVGIAAAGCRLVLRRASPNARYIAATVSLAVLAAMPLGIAVWMMQHPRTNVRLESSIAARGTATRVNIVNNEANKRFKNDMALRSQTTPTAPGSAGGLPAGGERFAGLNPRPSRGLPGELRTGQFASIANRLESCISYLPWLWLVGTPLTLVLLATGIVGTERLRRASQTVAAGPLTEMAARLARSLRVGRRVAIGVCERVGAPVLLGIVRPMILLPPAALTGWSPDEIEMVLLHELAHVRRWDNLVNLLQRLVESLLFFHPAVWLVSSWMRRDREACCDALVVTYTKRPHAYVELLVALAAQMPRSVLFHPAATSAMAASPLRHRIRRILQLEDDPMLISGKSFAFVLAGLLVAATAAVLYLPSRGQAEESATVSAENTEESRQEREKEQSAESMPADVPEADGQANSEPVNSAVDLEPSRRVEVEQARVGDEKVTVVRGARDDVNAFVKDPNAFVKQIEAGEDREPQKERRVLGTFSPDPSGQQDMLRAADEAREKNLYVDIVPNDGEWALVVAPEPTEADWPAMLGNPPRKERVIADKAWQMLGLKLVPASQLEQFDFDTRRLAGPVKILGGNVPDGLPLPAFLRQVGDNSLERFEDLHVWLLNQDGRRPTPVKVQAFANGHEYLFDAGPADEEEAAPAQESKSKFPSLEDQKLADLAWQMLQLELEPAGDEDLQRVRAIGYQGGVLVTGTVQEDRQGRSFYEIQRGDILVGLHVWPTTSLTDVAEILNRNDLADLNPLKFYVIRLMQGSNKDTVITGRISVRSRGSQPSGLSQLDSADRDSKNSAVSTGDLSAYVRQSGDRPAAASENEIKVLQDHIKTLQSHFDRIDALYKNGARGGTPDNRALAAYELAAAKGELALTQGQNAEALKRFTEAQSHAQDAFNAFTAAYHVGNATYDVVVNVAKNLANIKRKIIQLQSERPDSNRAASAASAAALETIYPFVAASQPAASPRSSESISVLKKIVEREKRKYDRMAELVQSRQVTSAEAETQKDDYEISLHRLRQAERALEYHRAQVAMAAAEYEVALEWSKKSPGAVTELELRKLQLKVQAAEAIYKALAE